MPTGPRRPMPRRCPRCAGPLYPGYDVDDLSCLFCGEYLFANMPERPPVPASPPTPPGPRKRGRPRKNPAAA